jgi:hypothetical protein
MVTTNIMTQMMLKMAKIMTYSTRSFNLRFCLEGNILKRLKRSNFLFINIQNPLRPQPKVLTKSKFLDEAGTVISQGSTAPWWGCGAKYF